MRGRKTNRHHKPQAISPRRASAQTLFPAVLLISAFVDCQQIVSCLMLCLTPRARAQSYRYGVGGVRLSHRSNCFLLPHPASPHPAPCSSPLFTAFSLPGYARRCELHGAPAEEGMEDMKTVKLQASAFWCSIICTL